MAYTNVWHLARWPLIVVALSLNYWSITCAVTHPTPDLARPCLTSVTVRHRVKQLRQPTTIYDKKITSPLTSVTQNQQLKAAPKKHNLFSKHDEQTVLHPARTVSFTGHENLTSVSLVQMSAEVYGAISLVATTFQLTIAFDAVGQNVG